MRQIAAILLAAFFLTFTPKTLCLPDGIAWPKFDVESADYRYSSEIFVGIPENAETNGKNNEHSGGGKQEKHRINFDIHFEHKEMLITLQQSPSYSAIFKNISSGSFINSNNKLEAEIIFSLAENGGRITQWSNNGDGDGEDQQLQKRVDAFKAATIATLFHLRPQPENQQQSKYRANDDDDDFASMRSKPASAARENGWTQRYTFMKKPNNGDASCSTDHFVFEEDDGIGSQKKCSVTRTSFFDNCLESMAQSAEGVKGKGKDDNNKATNVVRRHKIVHDCVGTVVLSAEMDEDVAWPIALNNGKQQAVLKIRTRIDLLNYLPKLSRRSFSSISHFLQDLQPFDDPFRGHYTTDGNDEESSSPLRHRLALELKGYNDADSSNTNNSLLHDIPHLFIGHNNVEKTWRQALEQNAPNPFTLAQLLVTASSPESLKKFSNLLRNGKIGYGMAANIIHRIVDASYTSRDHLKVLWEICMERQYFHRGIISELKKEYGKYKMSCLLTWSIKFNEMQKRQNANDEMNIGTNPFEDLRNMHNEASDWEEKGHILRILGNAGIPTADALEFIFSQINASSTTVVRPNGAGGGGGMSSSLGKSASGASSNAFHMLTSPAEQTKHIMAALDALRNIRDKDAIGLVKQFLGNFIRMPTLKNRPVILAASHLLLKLSPTMATMRKIIPAVERANLMAEFKQLFALQWLAAETDGDQRNKLNQLNQCPSDAISNSPSTICVESVDGRDGLQFQEMATFSSGRTLSLLFGDVQQLPKSFVFLLKGASGDTLLAGLPDIMSTIAKVLPGEIDADEAEKMNWRNEEQMIAQLDKMNKHKITTLSQVFSSVALRSLLGMPTTTQQQQQKYGGGTFVRYDDYDLFFPFHQQSREMLSSNREQQQERSFIWLGSEKEGKNAKRVKLSNGFDLDIFTITTVTGSANEPVAAAIRSGGSIKWPQFEVTRLNLFGLRNERGFIPNPSPILMDIRTQLSKYPNLPRGSYAIDLQMGLYRHQREQQRNSSKLPLPPSFNSQQSSPPIIEVDKFMEPASHLQITAQIHRMPNPLRHGFWIMEDNNNGEEGLTKLISLIVASQPQQQQGDFFGGGNIDRGDMFVQSLDGFYQHIDQGMNLAREAILEMQDLEEIAQMKLHKSRRRQRSSANLIGSSRFSRGTTDLSTSAKCRACKKTASALKNILDGNQDLLDAVSIQNCISVSKNAGTCENALTKAQSAVFYIGKKLLDDELLCDFATGSCSERTSEINLIKERKLPCSFCKKIVEKIKEILDHGVEKGVGILKDYCFDNADCLVWANFLHQMLKVPSSSLSFSNLCTASLKCVNPTSTTSTTTTTTTTSTTPTTAASTTGSTTTNVATTKTTSMLSSTEKTTEKATTMTKTTAAATTTSIDVPSSTITAESGSTTSSK